MSETEPHAELATFGPGDDPVELTRANATESQMIAAQLRGAGITTAVLGVGTGGEMAPVQYTYGSRIMVRRADIAAARVVLTDLFDHAQPPPPIDSADLAAQAEAAAGWSDPETGAVV